MSDGMTPQEEADWLDKFHPSQRALASRQLREKREAQRQQQSTDGLRAEVERLTEMVNRLLTTVNEQGAARVADYETMRKMRYELEWRRKEMGDLGSAGEEPT